MLWAWLFHFAMSMRQSENPHSDNQPWAQIVTNLHQNRLVQHPSKSRANFHLSFPSSHRHPHSSNQRQGPPYISRSVDTNHLHSRIVALIMNKKWFDLWPVSNFILARLVLFACLAFGGSSSSTRNDFSPAERYPIREWRPNDLLLMILRMDGGSSVCFGGECRS